MDSYSEEISTPKVTLTTELETEGGGMEQVQLEKGETSSTAAATFQPKSILKLSKEEEAAGEFELQTEPRPRLQARSRGSR